MSHTPTPRPAPSDDGIGEDDRSLCARIVDGCFTAMLIICCFVTVGVSIAAIVVLLFSYLFP